MRYLIANKVYDADAVYARPGQAGTVPVIPGRSIRKRKIRYDQTRYKNRRRIENIFCRRKDFRRITTRYDKLNRNFLAALALTIILAYWL